MPAATTAGTGGGAQRSFSLRRPFNQAPRLSIPKAKDSSPAASSAATTSNSKTRATQQVKLGSLPLLSLNSASQPGNPPAPEDDFFSDPLKPNNFISQKTITSITQDSGVQTGDPSKTLVKPSLAPSATFECGSPVSGSDAKGQPRITISTFLKSPDPMEDTSYQPLVSSASNALDLKTRPVSETLVNLAHRSWNSPNVSRSPSPSSRDENDSRSTSSMSSSTSPTKANGAEDSVGSKSESLAARPDVNRSPSLLGKARRPLSMFMRSSVSEPSVPPATLKKAYVGSTDSVSSLGERPALRKVKDELWEAYRLLENDFQRYSEDPLGSLRPPMAKIVLGFKASLQPRRPTLFGNLSSPFSENSKANQLPTLRQMNLTGGLESCTVGGPASWRSFAFEIHKQSLVLIGRHIWKASRASFLDPNGGPRHQHLLL